jgi:hypothetical protein
VVDVIKKKVMVPEEGVEPSRAWAHGILSRIKKGRKS